MLNLYKFIRSNNIVDNIETRLENSGVQSMTKDRWYTHENFKNAPNI